MKYVPFILPAIVALISIICIVLSYHVGNTAAMNANITAAAGWLTIAGDRFVEFLNKRN